MFRIKYAMAFACESDLAKVISRETDSIRFFNIAGTTRSRYLGSCGAGDRYRLYYEDASMEILEQLGGNLPCTVYIVFVRRLSRVVQLVLSEICDVVATICGYSLAGDLLFSMTFDIYQRLCHIAAHFFGTVKIGAFEALVFSVGSQVVWYEDCRCQYIHEIFGITHHRAGRSGDV